MSENNNTPAASSPANNGHPPTRRPSTMAAIFLKLMGVLPFEGGDIADGVTRVLSGYSSAYLLSTNAQNTEFCLIDTGADPAAAELLAVLRHKGVDARAVKAILLTHGHSDHSAGLRQFPDAQVYVGAGDRGFVTGQAPSDGFLPRLAGKKPDLAIADSQKLHDVADGQTITVGTRTIRTFAAPGHTRGSMVYLLDDLLFVGDAVTFTPRGVAAKPPLPVSGDVGQAVKSLAHLAWQFDDQGIQISTVVPSHSGTGSWDAVRRLTGTNQ